MISSRRTALATAAVLPVLLLGPAAQSAAGHAEHPGGDRSSHGDWKKHAKQQHRFWKHHGKHGHGVHVSYDAGRLVDLQPETDDPTDGVKARVLVLRGKRATLSGLQVKGFDKSHKRLRLGAHIHTGPCVKGDGDAAGPHYNRDVDKGREPVRVTPYTEVWLDFTVDRRGRGHALSIVPFRLPFKQAKSLVVHERATDETGAAGARLACISLD